MVVGKLGIKEALFSDDLSVEGSRIELIRFFSLFDKPDGKFNIVTP
jgi:alkyl sulfatase BDS1-like metallo-beta-lactamase superfamily hydrolase